MNYHDVIGQHLHCWCWMTTAHRWMDALALISRHFMVDAIWPYRYRHALERQPIMPDQQIEAAWIPGGQDMKQPDPVYSGQYCAASLRRQAGGTTISPAEGC